MLRMLKSRGGRFALAVIAGVLTLVLLVLPTSKDYSFDGISDYGGVTIECGSVINDDIQVKFDDSYEQEVWDTYGGWSGDYYVGNPIDEEYVFEGQSARQVCDEELSGNRSGGIGAGVVGGLLLVSSFLGGSNKRSPIMPPASGTSASGTAAASTNPPRWLADPLGRHEMRYWDGRGWTGHVSDAGVASVDDGREMPAADQTVHRPVGVAGAPAVAPSAGPEIVFESGRRVSLSTPVVIGRNPVSQAHLPGASLVSYDDVTRSISATHLAVGLEHGQVWVEDLASTNGSELVLPHGEVIGLTPGARTLLPAGASLRFGECSLSIQGL